MNWTEEDWKHMSQGLLIGIVVVVFATICFSYKDKKQEERIEEKTRQQMQEIQNQQDKFYKSLDL